MIQYKHFFSYLLLSHATTICTATAIQGMQCGASRYEHKHRVYIATDISNEPDDQMSLVRLLTYANEINIRSIAVVTSTWKNDSIDIDTVNQVIGDGYRQVVPRLNANVPQDGQYPTTEDLLAKVKSGHPVYGLAALELTPSEAALALIQDADASSSQDPLWVCLWGGASVLAEALNHVSLTRTPPDVSRFIEKLRVYSISDQDNAGAWLRVNYPSLFYIVSLHGFSDYSQASWNGISGEEFRHFDKSGPATALVSNDWLQRHIRVGELGAHYLNWTFIMEGDTPSFFPLIRNGLGDPEHPEWGGWGGRFLPVDVSGRYPLYSDAGDAVVGENGDLFVSSFATIWRWRKAYQNDFAARMRWSTSVNYSENNHGPIAVLNGTCGPDVVKLAYTFGDSLVMDASASWDPDGDALTYTWFHYQDVAQRLQGPIEPVSKNVTITPLDATGALVRLEPKDNITMHIILSVEDQRDMGMTAYRRIILEPTA